LAANEKGLTMDGASIIAALSGLKSIAEIAKTATDTKLALKINSEIADVQARLIEVQQQALALQESNNALRKEIEKSRAYRHHDSVIWKLKEDGKEDGPFCPVCMGEGIEMRLIQAPGYDQSSARSYWSLCCHKCQTKLSTKDKQPLRGRIEPLYRVPKVLTPDNYFADVQLNPTIA
jgi:hypothetical protein